MDRRSFLQTGMGVLGASLITPAVAQRRHPPNIVLIVADDLGYECLRCNGATEYQTPKLDALAGSGIRFTNAHSTPLCTPTRVQLMTGQYNFRNYTEFGSLPPGQFTFGHMVQRAGYRTCVVGKWQLAGRIEGTNYRGEGTLPQDAGFDEHCLWQVKDRGSRYWEPTVQVNGEVQRQIKGKFGPEVFTSYAEKFIERHRDRPFFLYYPMALTHDPFISTPRSKGSSAETAHGSDPVWFGDMVAYMDEVSGRIVAKIDQLGLAGNTLVIFTGDNGTHPSITTQTRSGPYRGGKGSTARAGTHVPLIARWQGTSPKGAICEDLIDFTDFLPTLGDLAGTSLPDDHPRDGRSFRPQLRGAKGDPRKWIFCDYNPKWGKFQPARWVMNKRWKLYGDGRFYDWRSDPGEQQPLVSLTAEMAQARTEFQAVLSRLRRTNA